MYSLYASTEKSTIIVKKEYNCLHYSLKYGKSIAKGQIYAPLLMHQLKKKLNTPIEKSRSYT